MVFSQAIESGSDSIALVFIECFNVAKIFV